MLIPTKCMGTTQAGPPCKLDGTPREDGWVGCGFHTSRPPDVEPHPCAEILADAMRHDLWSRVPGPIRHLVEWVWVEAQRGE